MKSQITMLGTGNALSLNCYNTCFVISTDGGRMLVDAGGGNQVLRQLKEANIPLTEIDGMYLTHAHTDHVLGAMWIIRMVSTAIHRGEYTKQFQIFAHKHLCELITMMTTEMLPKKIASELGKGIVINEVADGDEFSLIGARFTAFSIHSTKLEQFGFRMQTPSFTLACLGDEPYNEACKKYVEGADWMLCEAFCLYDDRDTFHPYEKHHSTAKDAAALAAKLGVKNLLLYHTEDKTIATRKERYTAEAKSEFEGNVFVPDDLDIVTLD